MACLFFDSSALFKRYVKEIGSAWVLGLADPAAGNDIYVVLITGAEIVSGLVRQNPPLPPPQFSSALADFRADFQNQYQRLAITEALVSQAMLLAERHGLRGYDAVQLAGAAGLQAVRRSVGLPPLLLISADKALNAAAVAEGLVVEDPNNHP